MKVSFLVLFLFLVVKICRSRNVPSDNIPEEWKKYPIQKPINNKKNFDITNNNKLIYPIGTSVPISHPLPTKTHIVKPAVNFQFPMALPLNNHINPINKVIPKIKEEPINQPTNLILQDNFKEGENIKDYVHINKTSELEKVTNTLYNKIPKANSEQRDNNNKQNQTDNDSKIFRFDNINLNNDIAKPERRKIEKSRKEFDKSPPENIVFNSTISNTTQKLNQISKISNDSEILKSLKLLTNNSSKNDNGSEVDSKSNDKATNRKSDIEIVINDTDDGTDDSNSNVIIHNEDYREIITGTNNKLQDFGYQNEQVPTPSNVQEVPYNYGQFTTNQYTKYLSDEQNYANEYQLETDTKQDDKYPLADFTQYQASIVPDVIKSNVGNPVNDYSNANKIWRSLRNTDVIIRNNPKNIKLFLNYRSSGNKKFNQRPFSNSHSDYKNLNSFKPYYTGYIPM